MEFEWDERKAALNFRKHGIRFGFATRVFLDENRVEWTDDREDYGEDRFITVGIVEDFELTVVYTLREDHIRIISAREADPHEIKAYWNG